MGLINNIFRNRDIAKARTPLERMFLEAKWDAIEKKTNDLEVYQSVQKMIEENIKENGYTDESKQTTIDIIELSAPYFKDKRFYEFMMRGINGER